MLKWEAVHNGTGLLRTDSIGYRSCEPHFGRCATIDDNRSGLSHQRGTIQMTLSRRTFLAAGAASIVAAGNISRAARGDTNSRIGVCTIGFNGQGSTHIKDILEMREEAEYVALCDVDSDVLEKGAKIVEQAQGKRPKLYRDIREALADRDIDAVTIATPNHWHSLAAIWACQAGKDVYVEKPLCHNIFEGRQLVEAAKKHGRIVQHGTQNRSNSTLIRDMKLIHDGFIGRIVESRGYVYKNGNRRAIGHGKPGAVPANLDWKLWQGPSRDHEFLVNADRPKPGLYVHYDWHWFWEYGNGEIGNQGVHEMDVAVWGHNRGLPIKVYSAGGRFGWEDDAQTPNTQATTFTYGDGTILTFEVRNLGSFEEAEAGNCGNSFFGTEGFYVRDKGFFRYEGKKQSDRKPIAVEEPKPNLGNKWDHFFRAVRSRKTEDMSVSTLDAFHSCVHCHLGNIAYQLGRSLEFDPKNERFEDDDANLHLSREYRSGFEVPKLA
jgi:predicted dehydrogenase